MPKRDDRATVRVLLIEGDPAGARDTVQQVRRAFAAGCGVRAAASGLAAIRVLRRWPADIVLMDIGALNDLGETAEKAVARLVRAAGGALLIALSDSASISAVVAAMRVGAHDFMARPIDPAEFGHRIFELARRHGKTGPLLAAAGPPQLMDASRQMQSVCEQIGRLAASTALAEREWPGNARQLQNLVRRLVTMFESGESSAAMVAAPDSEAHASERPETPLVLPMWRQEQRIIEDAIAAFSGNVARAAAALELSPSTIYRKRQAWAEAGGAGEAARERHAPPSGVARRHVKTRLTA